MSCERKGIRTTASAKCHESLTALAFLAAAISSGLGLVRPEAALMVEQQQRQRQQRQGYGMIVVGVMPTFLRCAMS